MRFPGDLKRASRSGRIARACIVLTSTTALAACGALGGEGPSADLPVMTLPANGPQADYPLTIGEPYVIGGRTYRPADVLNYDEVGYVTSGSGSGYTAAHHTLPYPSYVEVTSLETGRTILVRVERRGPMASDHLLSLSPDAMAQLDAATDTPVRVRRVNAPETQRALLRDGQAAPVRMDTPMGLVEVLRRRLPPEGSASLATTIVTPDGPALPVPADAAAPVRAEVMPSTAAPRPLPSLVEPGVSGFQPAAEAPASLDTAPETFADAFRPEIDAAPEPAAAPVAIPAIANGFLVQAAAFSTEDRARRAATALDGYVEAFGSLFRVRTGPFATQEEAEASLANVRAAGYSDARILTGGQG
jgi:rare lipoprotein A